MNRLFRYLRLKMRGYCFKHHEFPPMEYGGLFDFNDGHPGRCRSCLYEDIAASYAQQLKRNQREDEIKKQLLEGEL